MPLVIIYRNESTQGNKGLDAALDIIRRNIAGVLRDALEVKNVVVMDLPMKGDPPVFIDISCNYRDWRNKDLRARHQKVHGWISGVMKNNGVRPKNIHLRILLAYIQYELA